MKFSFPLVFGLFKIMAFLLCAVDDQGRERYVGDLHRMPSTWACVQTFMRPIFWFF